MGILWPRSLSGSLLSLELRVTTDNAGLKGIVAKKTPKKKKTGNGKKADKLRNRKPLRKHTEEALQQYFKSLNGDRPGDLYGFVLSEVEEPLFRTVMEYTQGNQSQAAGILGINRGTLRKKLKAYSLV